MRTLLFALLVALPLGACSNLVDEREGEMTADAGLAVRQNITAQLANPNAPDDHGAFITDGERAWRALDRYRRGAVIPPTSASGKNADSGGAPTTTDNQAAH